MSWWDCKTDNIFHIKWWSLFLLTLTLGLAMRLSLAIGTFALANVTQAEAWTVLVHKGSAAPGGPVTGSAFWLRRNVWPHFHLLGWHQEWSHPQPSSRLRPEESSLWSTKQYEIINGYCSKPLNFGVICPEAKPVDTDIEAWLNSD